VTALTNNGSFLRRAQDFPVLLVSQDYELFFQRSGSIENCLFEPTNMLLDFADELGIRITFFVDAGMLTCMQKLAPSHPSLEKDLSKIRHHIESIHNRGHEIGLHIHPHWEDTRWDNGKWDFSRTRYQLRDFSGDEVSDIVIRYATVLNELCDGSVTSYRAGGFCVEPFDVLKDPLLQNGITIDSSVVPGARLNDDDKGFDFSRVPNKSWWYFDESPLTPGANGKFLELAITPVVLPFYHYWGRAIDRLLGRQPAGVVGDGSSKAIGKREIVRRLAGAGRVSELSMDVAKARQLTSSRLQAQNRNVWQVMGHPKLLGKPSLDALQKFIKWKDIRSFESLSGLASAIRAGELSTRQD
jgi:hypothetical protein